MFTALGAPSVVAPRAIRLRGRSYQVVLPTIGDARLHVAATLLTVQVLGQVVVKWDLSIAQILVSLGTCALVEVVFVAWERGVLAWPASALLTGNGVALILRVPGVEHGQWWSLTGAGVFAGTAVFSVMSKYVLRVDGRPLFNPSNLGLVTCFLVLGSPQADPQELWWGPLSPGLLLVYAVIVLGGCAITQRLRVLAVAGAYWAVFAIAIAIVTLSGHGMMARWHLGVVSGWQYWWVLVASPEILIFLFFMITDPKTMPLGRTARLAHGVSVALVAGVLVALQRTEFATKVAVLLALTLVCSGRPVLERLFPVPGPERRGIRAWIDTRGGTRRTAVGLGVAMLLAVLGVVGVLVIAASSSMPASEVSLSGTPSASPSEALDGASVTIDDTTRSVDLGIDQRLAEAIASDLILDLEAERAAYLARDLATGETAVSGPRLEALRNAIAEGGTADDQAATYRFERFTILVLRDPSQPQLPPQIGVDAQGHQHPLLSSGWVPFRRTFTMSLRDGRWLIDT